MPSAPRPLRSCFFVLGIVFCQVLINLLSMTKLTFFHQKRKDSAIRTGVEVNDELALENFVPGDNERDPVILWYIDIRCESKADFPPDPEAARLFFTRIAPRISMALLDLARELAAGLDSDTWPARRRISNLPPGIKAELACSATQRVAGGEISMALEKLAKNWKQILADLNSLAETAR
jgi:hypothetical protein